MGNVHWERKKKERKKKKKLAPSKRFEETSGCEKAVRAGTGVKVPRGEEGS
jgi:hypothetical protein